MSDPGEPSRLSTGSDEAAAPDPSTGVNKQAGGKDIGPEGVAPAPALPALSRTKPADSFMLRKRALIPARRTTTSPNFAGSIPIADPAVPPQVNVVEPSTEVAEPQVSTHLEAVRGQSAVHPQDVEPAVNIEAEPVADPPVTAHDSEPEPLQQPSRPSGLVQLRNRWGWVLGIAALGLALWGQKLASDARITAEGAPPLLSWLLFGAAAILFALGIAPAPASLAHQTTPFVAGIKGMTRGRRAAFVGLLAGSLACGILSTALFYLLSSELMIKQDWLINSGSWLLYIAALLLLGAAWIVWERDRPSSIADALRGDAAARLKQPPSIKPLYSALIAAGLLVLALLLRLPGLDQAPPGLWFDEAQNGIVGLSLIEPNAMHPAFISAYTQMGAIFFYFFGLVVSLFGETSVWPLRLLPALMGSLIAPMLFVLGSRLFGWRVGLAAGVLVAVSAWNITMSRFGVLSLPTVALDVAAYLCLVQGLRTGRLGWYAGAGVLLGIAIQMYYPAQLVPIVIVLVLVHRLVSGRMAFFRAIRAGAVAFVVAALLASIPITTFAIQHSNEFTERAARVSIFSNEGSEGRPDALQISLTRHALMFNYQGDTNPRHNLPGEPMLDWLTGALFLAGLGVCALRAWRWQYFFVLVWFLMNISGGVLSVVFEAPQAHRTLENSVVTSLIAAIILGELWKALDSRIASTIESLRARMQARRASPSTQRAAVVRPAYLITALPALLALAWIGNTNIDRYFNKQVNDVGVWSEMGGVNRAMGERLAQIGEEYRVYASPDRANVPTTSYLAPGRMATVWPGGLALPFTEDRPVVMLFGPKDEAEVLTIKRIYPNAKVDIVRAPNHADAQLYNITVTPEDISSTRGTRMISDSQVATTLKIESYTGYTFSWLGDESAPTLMVDGAVMSMGTETMLAAGLHSVVISGTDGTKPDFTKLAMARSGEGPAPIAANLLFDPGKVEPRGLTAILRKGNDFTLPADSMRIDAQVSFYFHQIPYGRPYTVEWVGKIYLPVPGTYVFYTEQLSTSKLLIDNNAIITNNEQNQMQMAALVLEQGLHDIRLQYADLADFSHVYLYWTPPGVNGQFIIPTDFLLPQMASYPEVPLSGAWPSVSEADDTMWSLARRAAWGDQPEVVVDPNAPPTQPSEYPGERIVPTMVVGEPGNPLLSLPRAAAADAEGNIYIYSEGDSRIHKYNPDGQQIGEWDVLDPQGLLVKEGSAMVIREGKLLLLDAATSEVITYALDGKEEGRLRICGCYSPRGLSLANDGNLWIADTGFGAIYKVTPDGTLLQTIGKNGSEPGQFAEPTSVWEAPDGTLFVTDAANKRMQSLTPEGTPIAQWGIGEGTARDNNRVTGTPSGNALLGQYTARAIIEYGPDGSEKTRWVYEVDGRALEPAWVAPAGNGKYIALYPNDNTGIVFQLIP